VVGRIAREPTVAHREREGQRQNAMGLTDGRRRQARCGQVGDPRGDPLVGDVGQPDFTPAREHVDAEQTFVARPGRRLQVDLRLEPSSRPLPDGDARPAGVDVHAGRDGRRHLVEPSLGVHLSLEVTRVLPAGAVAVSSPPAPVRTLRNVGHVIASEPRDDLGVPRRSVSSEPCKNSQRQSTKAD
jgi:hypothetical protein